MADVAETAPCPVKLMLSFLPHDRAGDMVAHLESVISHPHSTVKSLASRIGVQVISALP